MFVFFFPKFLLFPLFRFLLFLMPRNPLRCLPALVAVRLARSWAARSLPESAVAAGSAGRVTAEPGVEEAEAAGAAEGRPVEAGTEGDEELEADIGEPEREVE